MDWNAEQAQDDIEDILKRKQVEYHLSDDVMVYILLQICTKYYFQVISKAGG